MNTNIYKKILSFCLLSSIFYLLSSTPVIASSVSVFPSILSLSLSPGKKTTTELTIGNNSASPLPLHIQFEPLILGDESTPLPSIGKWISFSKSSLLIPAHKQEKITVTFTLPKTIPLGGYYGMIYIEPLTSVKSKIGTPIMTKMGVLILSSIGVQDVPLNSIELQQPKVEKIINETQIIKFSYSVKNNAINHVSAKPYLVIHPFRGKVETVQLDERLVFPGKRRGWTSDIQISDSNKVYYSADLFVSIGNGLFHKKSFSFIIFPLRASIILVVCIGMGTSIFRKRKQITRAFEILVKG